MLETIALFRLDDFELFRVRIDGNIIDQVEALLILQHLVKRYSGNGVFIKLSSDKNTVFKQDPFLGLAARLEGLHWLGDAQHVIINRNLRYIRTGQFGTSYYGQHQDGQQHILPVGAGIG